MNQEIDKQPSAAYLVPRVADGLARDADDAEIRDQMVDDRIPSHTEQARSGITKTEH